MATAQVELQLLNSSVVKNVAGRLGGGLLLQQVHYCVCVQLAAGGVLVGCVSSCCNFPLFVVFEV